MEKYITTEQIKSIVENAPKGVDKAKLIDTISKKGYVIQGFNDQEYEKQKQQKSYGERLASDITGRMQDVAQPLKTAYETAIDKNISPSMRTVGTVAELGKVPLRAAGAAYGAVGDVIGQGVNSLTGDTQIKTLEQQRAENPAYVGTEKLLGKEGARTAADITNVLGGEIVGAAAKPVGKLIGKTAQEVFGAGKGAVSSISSAIKPLPSVERAIGQVSQGKIGDMKSFEKALSTIDLKGIKSYDQLNAKFDEVIPALSERVDSELLKDTVIKPLSAFKTTLKTTSGKPIEVNYVQNAIKDLAELYDKTGDVVKKAELDDLLAQGDNLELTNKTVNDISRQYGQEFGDKAFSKVTGEPLTSVNSQKFETTRKGLKDVARSGLGGKEAKSLDDLLSSVYDAKKLTAKTSEAVNKLKQRIDERGWVSKAAYNVVKGVDTLSGGVVRGVTDAVLNRGTGLKTLNALDLEKNLERNLSIIEKALQAKTEKEFVETLSKKNLNKAVGVLGNNTTYGGVAGLQMDENGEITFDPVAAGIGMAGMSISTKKLGQIKLNNIAKRMDNEDLRIIQDFQDGFSTKKLTEQQKEKMNNLLEQMKLYGISKHEDMATIGQILSELKGKIK